MFGLGVVKMKKLKRIDYSGEPSRDLLCIDVKSFFASVEAVERGIHPLESMIAVVSKPNIQGGLILASSPKVKEKYGIKTGSRVFELPYKSDIQLVEPRMALYLEKNMEIMRIFKQFVSTEDLYPYSIDEAFLDVTASKSLFGSPREIAYKIQQKIWKEIGLIVTIGIGDNPLLAKLCLDHQAKKDRENSYIGEWRYKDVPYTVWKIRPLSEFWGIGSRREAAFERMGINTIFKLSQSDPVRLKAYMGVLGQQYYFHAHGVDHSRLSKIYIPKESSYSKNQVLNHDYVMKEQIEIVIREMTEENAARLRKNQVSAGKVRLSVQYAKDVFERGFSKQMTIPPSDNTFELTEYMLIMFRKNWNESPVRVVNVTFGKIHPKQPLQLSLFEDADMLLRRRELDRAIDNIRERFGYTSLLHASSLLPGAMAKQRAQLLGGHRAGEDDE